MVRAKMFVESNTQPEGYDARSIVLRAVYSDSEENKTFSMYTPTAQLTMWVSNPNAFNYFETGKEYYIDFTQADI